MQTILCQPATIEKGLLAELRTQFDRIFARALRAQDTKQHSARVPLDDPLLACFAALSPQCRDEELEDLVYFVLDLYQFHGVPVAIAEVDVDQVVLDLRGALEEHVRAMGPVLTDTNAHLFLVLDKNVQGIPWESIPTLRGRSVSRVPSVDFLVDRLDFAALQQGSPTVDRTVVDPRSTYYVLNPSGDLVKTEGRFTGWLREMREGCGWEGVIGRPPSEQQLLDALARKDLVV